MLKAIAVSRAPELAAVGALAMLAACTPAPGPAAHLAMADIEPILTPLTYRQLLGEKCGEPKLAVKTEFMTELKTAGAPQTLLDQAQAEAAKIEAADRDTLNEYVCTAELFESTEKNAAKAQKAWVDLKNRKS